MFPFHLLYSLWLPVVNCGLLNLVPKKSLFTQFDLSKFEKKNVGLLEGNKNVIRNFYPSSLINKNSVPLFRKETLVFWRSWINPRSCRDCRDSYCTKPMAVDSCDRQASILFSLPEPSFTHSGAWNEYTIWKTVTNARACYQIPSLDLNYSWCVSPLC